ncbi:Uncharacterised protein [Iodobacter fluviatilis]|uniref:Uncharacterized protein n=1 Tax=Iodobacter fluviatilis TaxID=537 RepID=A0A377Q9Z3_9NEIS|nr:hypothetical protein [Iodobacter fluviatilis]STQ90681.1 Uncharacterised protein [Iodobacter fluviatilis]
MKFWPCIFLGELIFLTYCYFVPAHAGNTGFYSKDGVYESPCILLSESTYQDLNYQPNFNKLVSADDNVIYLKLSFSQCELIKKIKTKTGLNDFKVEVLNEAGVEIENSRWFEGDRDDAANENIDSSSSFWLKAVI